MPTNPLLAIQPPSRSGSSRVARLEPSGARTCAWPLPRRFPPGPMRGHGGSAGLDAVAARLPGVWRAGSQADPRYPGQGGTRAGCRTHTHPTRHGAPCGLQINPVTRAPPRRLHGPGRGGDEPDPYPARAFARPPALGKRGLFRALRTPGGRPVHTRRAVGDRHPMGLVVKRHADFGGAPRRCVRCSGCRFSGSRAGCRRAGWRAGAAPRDGRCRGCGVRRSRRGRRVRR
jgi:hypothetical protein